jgi:hypothetical protein
MQVEAAEQPKVVVHKEQHLQVVAEMLVLLVD